MKNNWNAEEAKEYIKKYEQQGCNTDLAIRVYTSRLLGREHKMILHGGGNTSVKTNVKDILGRDVKVLCVKGSGWDMGVIEPEGLPAVRLEPLLEFRVLDALSDEDMVNCLRTNLMNSASPNPSVETLLHAFLPHKFIDHTHSSAINSISNMPNYVEVCQEIYGQDMGTVDYIMPGFALAKSAMNAFESSPHVKGLLLQNHGIFTFAEDGKEAYDLMIEYVSRAEEFLQKNRRSVVFEQRAIPQELADVAEVAPVIRGALAQSLGEGSFQKWILHFRTNETILHFVNGEDVKDYARRGPATPEQVIRIKPKPLIAPVPQKNQLQAFETELRQEVASFIQDYQDYFHKHNARFDGIKKILDTAPRVILVPGMGLFGVGETAKDARISADMIESLIESITDAEAIGEFRALSEADLFDMEYWSLEQAKLHKKAEKALSRQIVAITGGAGVLGLAIGQEYAKHGAEVALLDVSESSLSKALEKLPSARKFVCDVTNPQSVKDTMNEVVCEFGGLDILVSNAGSAWTGSIAEVSESVLKESFELNFFGHQRASQAAVAIFKKQKTGGLLSYNISKQAINPGQDFGPYGLAKASLMFLMRQYALECAADGIRANGVNPDRIRSGLLTDAMIQERAKARQMTEQDYMKGNLLKLEVLAKHVAKAFVDHALAPRTTADITTVDGGNIVATLR